MIPVDLHCHSNYSDALPSIEKIEAHCLRENMGIALSDHNEIRGSLKLAERGRIPLIPAIEVGTLEGPDILVYFRHCREMEDFFIRHVEPFLFSRFMVRSRIETLPMLEAAASYDTFISMAHPYASGRKSILYDGHSESMKKGLLKRINGVEIFNGGISADRNRQATRLVKRTGKKITAGSDAHELKHFGSVHVKMSPSDPLNREELFTLLTENEFPPLFTRLHKRTRRVNLKHVSYFLKRGRRNR